MNIAISGSRNFPIKYYYLLKIMMDNNRTSHFVLGDAKGVDTEALVYCKENDFSFEVHQANWKTFGRSAGVLRNQQMIENADMLFYFRYNKSPGTTDVIDRARNIGLPVVGIDIEIDDYVEKQVNKES